MIRCTLCNKIVKRLVIVNLFGFAKELCPRCARTVSLSVSFYLKKHGRPPKRENGK